MGGAIFNHNGVLLITNSTFSANVAQGGIGGFIFSYDGYTPGGGGSAFGGAIFNLNGSITLLNSTLASNVVAAGLGGIAMVQNSTNIVDGPPGAAAGGAMYNLVYDCALVRTAKVTIINSILAGSVGGLDVVNDMPTIHSPLYATILTNLGSAILIATEPNLIQPFTNTGGSFTNPGVITNNPLLGPLANNGGPTPTMAPLPGSPALDAGDNSNAPATDQRGQARIWNGTVDLGAVEFQTPLSFTAPQFFQPQRTTPTQIHRRPHLRPTFHRDHHQTQTSPSPTGSSSAPPRKFPTVCLNSPTPQPPTPRSTTTASAILES